MTTAERGGPAMPAAPAPAGDAVVEDRRAGFEPPVRVHRPLDLVRLLFAVATLAGALLVGAISVHTVAGIGADVNAATGPLPVAVIVLLSAGSGLLLLILPIGLGVDLLFNRHLRSLADSLFALALTWGISAAAQPLLAHSVSLTASLVGSGPGSRPLHGYVAGIVAMITVAQVGRRPRWRVVATVALALAGVALISIGFTALAVVVSLLLGRVCGLAVRWVAGAPSSRPRPRDVVTALRRVELTVSGLRPTRPEDRAHMVFLATDAEARPLLIYVLDRDHEGSNLLPSIWRTVRMRQSVGWWALLSMRRTLDQLALTGMAIAATGARAQRLVAAATIEPNAAVLAFEDVPGPTFAEAGQPDLTDESLDSAWAQVGLLHRRSIAHRSLEADNLVLTAAGGAALRITLAGQIAASESALRIDLTQLLVTLALLVGPKRAVESALRVAGPAKLATTVPYLQPIVLGRATRRALRRGTDLLDELRENILAVEPTAPVEPVRVERLRLRTVVSAVLLTLAASVLVSQIGGLDVVAVVRSADWRWLAAAAIVSAIRYPGAALGLDGFVAERLPLARTMLVQVASSFLALMAPAGVGGAALNVRYLQRSGVPAAAAVASVALWQIGTFVTTVGLLVGLNVATGSSRTSLLSVPKETPLALGVVAAIGGLVFAIPKARHFVVARLKPYADQVKPRVGSVLTRPGRLATGLAGTLLQTVATVLVMSMCIDAFGGSVQWSLVAVIVLAGTALASAAPTPGGLGAVEAVLVTGLTAAGGLTAATALSSVLLFRILTFWLPVAPGWLAFTLLQRRNAI